MTITTLICISSVWVTSSRNQPWHKSRC